MCIFFVYTKKHFCIEYFNLYIHMAEHLLCATFCTGHVRPNTSRIDLHFTGGKTENLQRLCNSLKVTHMVSKTVS